MDVEQNFQIIFFQKQTSHKVLQLNFQHFTTITTTIV